jgi:hypothetical protein
MRFVSIAENVVTLHVHDDDLVRVASGEYLAVYVRHVGVTVFQTAKIRVDFRLLEHSQRPSQSRPT